MVHQHRSHSCDRRTDSQRSHRALGYREVPHTLSTELLGKPPGGSEHSAGIIHQLPNHQNLLAELHRLLQPLPEGLGVR